MSIIALIVIVLLIIVGFWANNTYVSPPILRIIINVILVIILVVLILRVAGIGNLGNTRVLITNVNAWLPLK